MRINKNILFLILILIAILGCKKTKLDGEYSGLTGNWVWIWGWEDGGNTNFKLDLIEKGKYTLYNGSDKIDFGRLVEKNNTLTFISDKLFHKGHFSSGETQITSFKNDTLELGNNTAFDFPSSGL
ncbi:MAG: hypothetical protein ACYDCN_10465 [Bacteroidia bacterium]